MDDCHLRDSELFLAAIHDHGSPILSFDATRQPANNVVYTKGLRDSLVRLVQQALDRLAPVKLQGGRGSSPVGSNRRQVVSDTNGNPRIELGRNPERMTDREVQVLKVTRSDNGEPGRDCF